MMNEAMMVGPMNARITKMTGQKTVSAFSHCRKKATRPTYLTRAAASKASKPHPNQAGKPKMFSGKKIPGISLPACRK